ncbi:hypothetical protein Barb4_00421 [Bacteroidales bacterium Barb4]|nr:hypothetical protein Barb4_00421 [Bacteroidales bacterium Barb4]
MNDTHGGNSYFQVPSFFIFLMDRQNVHNHLCSTRGMNYLFSSYPP